MLVVGVGGREVTNPALCTRSATRFWITLLLSLDQLDSFFHGGWESRPSYLHQAYRDGEMAANSLANFHFGLFGLRLCASASRVRIVYLCLNGKPAMFRRLEAFGGIFWLLTVGYSIMEFPAFSYLLGRETPREFRPLAVAAAALDQHKRYKGPLLTGTIRLFWISWQILRYFAVITNSHTLPYILNPPTPPPKPGPPVIHAL